MVEIRTLFGFQEDPEAGKKQRQILDDIAQKHGLPPGKLRDCQDNSPQWTDGRQRTAVEAYVLEDASRRGLSIKETIRNVVTARIRMDSKDLPTEPNERG